MRINRIRKQGKWERKEKKENTLKKEETRGKHQRLENERGRKVGKPPELEKRESIESGNKESGKGKKNTLKKEETKMTQSNRRKQSTQQEKRTKRKGKWWKSRNGDNGKITTTSMKIRGKGKQFPLFQKG